MFFAALMALLLNGSCQPSLPYAQSVSDPMPMTQSSVDLPFALTATLLEVYEDRVAPPGSQPNSDRPVGHAVVRLRLENLTEHPVNLEIQRVEIHAEPDARVLMTQTVEAVNLGGLQILERGLHLTNSQGFGNATRVRAIVVYQMDGTVYTTASAAFPVTVNR